MRNCHQFGLVFEGHQHSELQIYASKGSNEAQSEHFITSTGIVVSAFKSTIVLFCAFFCGLLLFF